MFNEAESFNEELSKSFENQLHFSGLTLSTVPLDFKHSSERTVGETPKEFFILGSREPCILGATESQEQLR